VLASQDVHGRGNSRRPVCRRVYSCKSERILRAFKKLGIGPVLLCMPIEECMFAHCLKQRLEDTATLQSLGLEGMHDASVRVNICRTGVLTKTKSKNKSPKRFVVFITAVPITNSGGKFAPLFQGGLGSSCGFETHTGTISRSRTSSAASAPASPSPPDCPSLGGALMPSAPPRPTPPPCAPPLITAVGGFLQLLCVCIRNSFACVAGLFQRVCVCVYYCRT
jgi:hypothetical protein